MNITIWSKGGDESKELSKGKYKFHFDFPFSWPDSFCTTQPHKSSIEVAGVKKGIIVHSIAKKFNAPSHVIATVEILDNPVPLLAIFGVLGVLGLGILFLTRVERILVLPIVGVIGVIFAISLLKK